MTGVYYYCCNSSLLYIGLSGVVIAGVVVGIVILLSLITVTLIIVVILIYKGQCHIIIIVHTNHSVVTWPRRIQHIITNIYI